MTDVIVIGGGIAGISAAAEIAAGADVLVLEAEPRCGYHTTGRSAAIFSDDYGTAAIRALSALARLELAGPDPQDWPTPLLSPRGELLLAEPGREDALAVFLAEAPGAQRPSSASIRGPRASSGWPVREAMASRRPPRWRGSPPI